MPGEKRRHEGDDESDDGSARHSDGAVEDVSESSSSNSNNHNQFAIVSANKKPRQDIVPADTFHNKSSTAIVAAGPRRTSALKAPIMLLSGHEGEVLACKFSPNGKTLASGSFDKNIFLWEVYDENKNYGVLKGHSGPVLDLHWTADGSRIVSASTDKVVGLWDAEAGVRTKQSKGHTSFVNACQTARLAQQMYVSGSDDASTKVWDARIRKEVHSLACRVPVTAVALSDAADFVYSGGIDDVVKIFDLRNPTQPSMVLQGHADSITGLALSHSSGYLLTNAMDNTLRMWDVRPYCPGDRCLATFVGAQHGFDKNLLRCAWSKDDSHVTAGSADRHVYVWNVTSRNVVYRLPGHSGSVNDVDLHPSEPILLSGSSDKKMFLGELDLS